MMKNMIRWQQYDNLIRNIITYDRKNIELVDLLLQIEKVAALRNSQEYELVTTKSTRTPSKMLKIMGYDLSWQEIKWKLE